MSVFMRIGHETLGEARAYTTKRLAIAAYALIAESLARYDQQIEATLHYAKKREELDEYPDFALSIGPRGGVRCDRA